MDDDDPPGVPEWVVTYGDMMSLLLTFFIMLVSLSEVVAESKFRAIMEAARQYLGYTGAPAAPPGKNFPLNSVVDSLRDMKLGSVSDDAKGSGGVKQKAPPAEDLRVHRLREGESQLAGRPIYFAPGQGDLDEAARQQLDAIAREVAGKPQKLEIRVFSSPFLHGMPQSAEDRLRISYARGTRVREYLETRQVEHKRFRVAVYFNQADALMNAQSIKPSDRVEVTILDEFADTYIGREQDYR